MWWNNDGPQGAPSPIRGWDWSGLQGCLATSNPEGSRSASTPHTSPVLLQPQGAAVAQEPHEHNSRKAQGPQFGQASYSFIPSCVFFFLSVRCCKSQPSFHLLHVGIEFIPCANHRAPSPQNPSVTAVFPRQDYTSSPYTHNTTCAAPGLQIIAFSSPRDQLGYLREPPGLLIWKEYIQSWRADQIHRPREHVQCPCGTVVQTTSTGRR